MVISGAEHVPPEAVQVPIQMENLINLYNNEWKTLHPVERASYLHVVFVTIHPFIDGNGRTARLLLNIELMKNGYPPIIIEQERRSEYYTALYKAHITSDIAISHS